VSAAVCATLACLRAHEGECIVIEGTIAPSNEVPLLLRRIRLEDGTAVFVGAFKALSEEVLTANQNKRIRVAGRIFTGEIPRRYGIVARSADPYLLDITGFRLL
jgi:hypothetical protein